MNEFTLVDYSAFGLWILISIGFSYLLVRKFNLFGGDRKSQKILTLGLIAVKFILILFFTNLQ